MAILGPRRGECSTVGYITVLPTLMRRSHLPAILSSRYVCLDSTATMVVERRHESFHLHEPYARLQMRPVVRVRRLRKGTARRNLPTYVVQLVRRQPLHHLFILYQRQHTKSMRCGTLGRTHLHARMGLRNIVTALQIAKWNGFIIQKRLDMK